jgi:hypothetical protein
MCSNTFADYCAAQKMTFNLAEGMARRTPLRSESNLSNDRSNKTF